MIIAHEARLVLFQVQHNSLEVPLNPPMLFSIDLDRQTYQSNAERLYGNLRKSHQPDLYDPKQPAPLDYR